MISYAYAQLRRWLQDCQTDDALGQATAEEYWQAAQKADRPFIPIYLSCDTGVNIKRATSTERTQGTTTKLTDAGLLRDILSRCKLFRFENSPYEACHIDTTDLTPEHVALRIRTYIEECLCQGNKLSGWRLAPSPLRGSGFYKKIIVTSWSILF